MKATGDDLAMTDTNGTSSATEHRFDWSPTIVTYGRVVSRRGKVAHLVTDADLRHRDFDFVYRLWPPATGEPICGTQVTEDRPDDADVPVCKLCAFLAERIATRVDDVAWCDVQGRAADGLARLDLTRSWRITVTAEPLDDEWSGR